MSPGGNTIVPENTNGTDSPRGVTKEPLWPSNRPTNENIIRNNNNLLRRSSLSAPKNKKDEVLVRQCEEEKKKVVQCVLPDVLPVSAKVMVPRSQQFASRPSHLSLNLDSTDRLSKSSPPPSPPHESIPNSPTKSPLRMSPPNSLTPLRNSPLSAISSNSPLRTSPAATSPLRSSPATSNSPIRTSPLSLSSIRTSPLSIAPLRISPLSTTSSPPKTPLTSPPRSPLAATSTSDASTITRTSESLDTPKVIEGLQMIQRTEVILRVNACTIDAASQTEKEEMPLTPLPTRRKLQEEIDCEKLSQDLVNQLSPSDRLKCILVPGPDHKKPTDYISGLFRIDVTLRPRPANSPFRSRNNTPSSSPPPTTNQASTMTSILTDTSIDTSIVTVPSLEPSSPLSATSTYFTTSESKAKFLTRYSRDMSQFSIVKDTKDLNQQKEELVSRLDRKLEVLRSEQLVVSEDCRVNDELGENVNAHVNSVARPHEAAKYRLHVEEVGKITSLLLGLSGRLARAENALMGLADDHAEKKILEAKRDKLQEQLEEAKKLKESIDRRSVCVSNMLYQYLNSEEYADYDHFINMKAKLIMDSREIADKIKLGEEQLVALKETLVVTN